MPKVRQILGMLMVFTVSGAVVSLYVPLLFGKQLFETKVESPVSLTFDVESISVPEKVDYLGSLIIDGGDGDGDKVEFGFRNYPPSGPSVIDVVGSVEYVAVKIGTLQAGTRQLQMVAIHILWPAGIVSMRRKQALDKNTVFVVVLLIDVGSIVRYAAIVAVKPDSATYIDESPVVYGLSEVTAGAPVLLPKDWIPPQPTGPRGSNRYRIPESLFNPRLGSLIEAELKEKGVLPRFAE